MNIITGYRGEPHITSSQDRAKNQGMYGTGSYIMNVGQKLQTQVVSANEIRIRDGVLSHQGCVAVIENGAYDTLEISNGTQGMQRRDLIVARYTKDAETNVEDITLVVIEGIPAASNPSDPAYNHGDIQAGDSPVDFPLYRVNISGVTVSGTTRLASYVQTQAEADAAINTLNSKTTASITLSSNVTQSTSYTSICEKTGKMVTIYFAATANTAISSGTQLGTIPSGYRPPRGFRHIMYASGGTCCLEMKANGEINAIGAISSGAAIIGVVTYQI